MLISKPPVEINDSVVMLGTAEYPIYLVRNQGEGAVFEGGVGAMGPVLQQQIERLGREQRAALGERAAAGHGVTPAAQGLLYHPPGRLPILDDDDSLQTCGSPAGR